MLTWWGLIPALRVTAVCAFELTSPIPIRRPLFGIIPNVNGEQTQDSVKVGGKEGKLGLGSET